jgi:hypothetical protein
MSLEHRNVCFALFAFTAALSGCKYFSSVVVPARDTEAPVPVVGLWSAALQDYALIRTGITPLEFVTSDPDAQFMAVASGVDSGGVRQVKLQRSSRTLCSKGEISSLQTATYIDQVVTQDGAVGSTVKNGLWSGDPIRGRDLDTCPAGFTLQEATYSWTTEVTDFHDNTSGLVGTFRYKP